MRQVTNLCLFPVKAYETARDYLHFTLLTGLRKGESCRLMWRDVDFEDKTITIRETKNKEIHILPLSDFLLALLARRHNQKGSVYVFPSDSKHGHFTDPKSAVNRVVDLSNIQFCMHDLRRTFITTAESLDMPVYALKRLLMLITPTMTGPFASHNVVGFVSAIERLISLLFLQVKQWGSVRSLTISGWSASLSMTWDFLMRKKVA